MAQIALLVCVGVVAALVPGALASGGLAWGTGAEAPLPAGAASNPGVSLPAVSCPSAGNCAAVGSYIDGSSDTQGLLLSETSGAWTAAEAQLPSAATNPGVFLTSVACASAGNCTAVGGYLDGSSHSQGLLLTETAGSWATGATAPVPANAATNPEVQLSSVSCPSATDCTAVGEYVDSSADTQGLLLNETSGTWTAVEAPLPSASANPLVSLSSVACASAGNCTAVGGYSDSSGFQGLLLTETAGSWTTPSGPAPVPGNAAANPGVLLSSVSCSSAGNCSAVGDYFDGSFNQLGLLLTQTSGSWSASEAGLPSDASTSAQLVDLSSVSCVSSGECTAVGGYYDNSSNAQGVLLTESSGSWGSGAEATLPAGASSPSLFSVSCASAGNCAAVGSYTDSSSAQQGLLLSESADTWGTGEKAALPTGASTGTPAAVALGVSCPGDTDCTAVGSYSDSSGNQQGLLLSTSSSPTLAVSGPSTGTAGTAIPASSISATLSGGASPTGTITFKVFAQATAPTDCSGGTTVGTPVSVSGNGTYNPSAPFTPSGAGDYWWYASYGGDGNNSSAASTCGTLMAETTVGKATTTLSASGPSSGTAGTTIPETSITATLSGGATPGGTITFKVVGPQSTAPTDCSAGTTVGTANVSGNGTYYPTTLSGSIHPTVFGWTPTSVGDYWWYASYDGDANNNPAASTCGTAMAKMLVRAAPSLSVSEPSAGTAGTAIPATSISATLSNGASPTGTITFKVFAQASAPTDCSGGTTVGTPVSVSGNGTYNPSAPFTPASAGAYWWYASYGGDGNNSSAASTCGTLMAETTVGKATTTLSASGPSSGTAGTTIPETSITATLSGGATPGGTITFKVVGPQPTAPTDCSAGTTIGTANVSGNGTYNPTTGFTPISGGDYWWYASYGGDTSNSAADSTCGDVTAETVVSFPNDTPVFSEVTDSPFVTGAEPFSVSFSPDGNLLATANYGANTVSVFSVGSGGALTQVSVRSVTAPNAVAFSSDGKHLAATDFTDGSVWMFSVGSGGKLTGVSGSPFATGAEPVSVSFSPDRNLLATANDGANTVSVFSVGSGGALTQLSVLSVDSPDAVAFSPSGGLLAATERGFSSSVAVFSVGSEGTLTEVTDQGMPGTNLPDSVSFSPDGKLLATADPGTDGVSVYSVGSGGALAQLGDFTAGGAPQSVAFSPSGRLLATANHDSDTASVFSVTSGGTLTEVSGSPFSTGTGSGPNSVAFSPDGKLFATANSGNDTVSVFSAANSTTASSSTSGGTATAILGSGTTATATGEGSMTLKDYSSDPTPTPAPAGSAYFDVHVSAGNSFSKLTVTDCNLNGATSLEWWNGSAWRQVSPVSSSPGPPACLTATLDNSTSSPRISQLTGTVFAAAYLGKPRVGRVRVRGATARVRTRCTGVRKDRCLVALVLEKRHGRRTRILGRAKVMLEAERARTVRVALDRAGKRLLAQHRTLKATLAITQLGHRLSSRTITFKAPRDEEWHEPPTRR